MSPEVTPEFAREQIFLGNNLCIWQKLLNFMLNQPVVRAAQDQRINIFKLREVTL